jgi:hypothetical protein
LPQINDTSTNEELMPEPNHASYLLRIWRDHTRSPWRVMVIDVARPGEHQHFATLDALFDFLAAQTGPAPPPAHKQVSTPIKREHNHCTPDGVAWEEPLE